MEDAQSFFTSKFCFDCFGRFGHDDLHDGNMERLG